MRYEIWSYRFARQILEHPNYKEVLEEILRIVAECPLYLFPGKRCQRELPSAQLSITLPILMIALDIDDATPQFDVSTTAIGPSYTGYPAVSH